MNRSTNYYEILEVAADAPSHEIHKAYQRAKATYSADNPALYSMFSPDEARELLRLIEEAYSVLGNPTLRKSYDDGRQSIQAPSAAGILPPHSIVSAAPQPPPVPVLSAPERADDSVGSVSIHKDSAASQPPLAPGMARTTLSTYQIDETFEAELKSASDFDGRFLQRIRLYKNVNIDRLSEVTRISRPYLVALESNDYKSLPAAVFTRGFVVQYAKFMGLDENKVAASYIKMFKAGGGK